jgi:hypothetical protein
MKTTQEIVKRGRKIAGYSEEIDGGYVFPHPKIRLYYYQVIASTGLGWEHVSITLRQTGKQQFVQRCPTWAEMCYIKDLFWNEDETVVQYHPAKTEHVSVHNFCLHLWRPTEVELPTPLKIMVG